MAYAGYAATPALTHTYSSRSGYATPRTPGPGYDDYSRYPYGDPVYGDATSEYAGYGDVSTFVFLALLANKVSSATLFLRLFRLRDSSHWQLLRKW